MDKSCQLESVYNRLKEAHKFWHDMLETYQDPEFFRINLNHAIQSLRNVTFTLQNHKDLIPNFDTWYSPHQEIMKNDNKLKWLHDARTEVVHKKDLELCSVATAQVLNWEKISLLKMKISPFIKTDQLAKDLIRLHIVEIPKILPERTILNVEREWIVNDLPNDELLSVIAYSYNFLLDLVNSAHKLSGCDRKPTSVCKKRPCMASTRDDRSVNINLGTGDAISVKLERLVSDDESDEFRAKVREHTKNAPKLTFNSDFISLVREVNERAKYFLELDKTHAMVFIIYLANGSCLPVGMAPANQAEKIIGVRSIADKVREEKAEGVIAISEAWGINYSDYHFTDLATHPKKREYLNVIGVSKKGSLMLSTPFSRDKNGNIILAATEERGVLSEECAIMAPIIKALGLDYL